MRLTTVCAFSLLRNLYNGLIVDSTPISDDFIGSQKQHILEGDENCVESSELFPLGANAFHRPWQYGDLRYK